MVGVISPWNYPFDLSISPIVGALLAGNTVVLKPSEVTAATGLFIEKLFKRLPELEPYVRVIHGDGSVGAAFVQSKPDYIFVTGSTATGRIVSQSASANLTPVACELGGKDAMLVLEDADLPSAARWGVWGAFFNAGQTCMGIERVYVHEQVYDKFLSLVLEETQRVSMGYSPDLRSKFYMGPISDPRQLGVIKLHLDDACEKEARILTGGSVDGNFINPTVLVDVNHDMRLMHEETFGPLMPIVKVRNDEEAIRLANDSEFGLGASVWSRDIQHAWRIAQQLEAASIIVNDTLVQFAIPMLPFGGIKNSGYGRVHGKEGVLQFTRSISYAVGNAPLSFDIGTIMRSPGKYNLAKAIMGVARGVSLKQRMKAVAEAIRFTRNKEAEGDERALM
jgi:acyl-CoA reductase-like NAD-dependent aldehyde dehydrogenase